LNEEAMTDQEHAAAVAKALEALNAAIKEAATAGLEVVISTTDIWQFGCADRSIVTSTIKRPIR
jgi:hypothetical protein